MKYCSECGHANGDHVKFCESCGHAFADAGRPASKPAGQQAGNELSATVQKASKSLASAGSSRTLVLGGAALVVVLALWLVFLKPASPEAYEMKAEDNLADIADGLNLINDGVSGLYSYASDEKMTAEDYADYEADVDEGVKMATGAAKKLQSLRAPGEYKAADRRIKAFATYVLDDAAPAARKLLDDVEPGMVGERLDSRVSRYWEQNGRGADRAYESLRRAAEDVYIPASLVGEY